MGEHRVLMYTLSVRFARKQAAFVAGTLAVISGIAGILAWWLPSSATWLNHHGFAAWPLAIFSLVLLIWAASNWYRSSQELATIRAKMQEPVKEDAILFAQFKEALPKDSPVLYWLRTGADDRTYRASNISPLRTYAEAWRSADRHFLNDELENAAKKLTDTALDFTSYQAHHSEWAPQSMQTDKDDPVYRAYDYDQMHSEIGIKKGLAERADRVLEAHAQLYAVGSRFGL